MYIKLSTLTLQRAIERAKAYHPKVSFAKEQNGISFYFVQSETKACTSYLVQLTKIGQNKLGKCDCQARVECKHIPAACSLHIARKSQQTQ